MNERIDTELTSRGQQAMREVVSQLPEDTVSLIWRSELNEKLRLLAVEKQKTRRWRLLWAPGLGVAVTACVAAAVMLRVGTVPQVETVASRGVESYLATAHAEESLIVDLSEVGIHAGDGRSTPTNASSPSHEGGREWDEVDVESL